LPSGCSPSEAHLLAHSFGRKRQFNQLNPISFGILYEGDLDTGSSHLAGGANDLDAGFIQASARAMQVIYADPKVAERVPVLIRFGLIPVPGEFQNRLAPVVTVAEVDQGKTIVWELEPTDLGHSEMIAVEVHRPIERLDSKHGVQQASLLR
jgi:hypothetical protein